MHTKPKSINIFSLVQCALLIVTLISVYYSQFLKPQIKSITVREGKITSADVNNQQIRIKFSFPMRHTSVQNAFSILPKVTGNYSWTNNYLIFTPDTSLNYDTTYTITINSQAEDIYGKKLERDFHSSITTKPYQFLYIGDDNNLYRGSLATLPQQLTFQKNISQYFIHSASGTVYFIHNTTNIFSELYAINLNTNQINRIANNIEGSFMNLALSEASDLVYFAVIPTSNLNADTTPSAYTYNIKTKETNKISLFDDKGYLYKFFLLPDGNTVLLSDTNEQFFLRAIDTKQTLLIGSFNDYGGANSLGNTLAFVQLTQSFPKIVLYTGQTKIISQEDQIGVLPSVNNTGTMISYSYKHITSDLAEAADNFSLQVVSQNSQPIMQLTDPSISYEQSEFSGDNAYLAIETKKRSKKDFSAYIFPMKDAPLGKDVTSKIVIFSLSTKQQLPASYSGRRFKWIY